MVEAILAHKEKDSARASYNFAKYLTPTRSALQWYADHIDKLALGGEVIQFKAA